MTKTWWVFKADSSLSNLAESLKILPSGRIDNGQFDQTLELFYIRFFGKSQIRICWPSEKKGWCSPLFFFSISPSSFPWFVHIFGLMTSLFQGGICSWASHPFASSSRQWCSLDPNFQRSNTRPTWWPATWRSTSPSATPWSIQWAFFLLGEVEVRVDNSLIKAFVYVWHVTHTHT